MVGGGGLRGPERGGTCVPSRLERDPILERRQARARPDGAPISTLVTHLVYEARFPMVKSLCPVCGKVFDIPTGQERLWT